VVETKTQEKQPEAAMQQPSGETLQTEVSHPYGKKRASKKSKKAKRPYSYPVHTGKYPQIRPDESSETFEYEYEKPDEAHPTPIETSVPIPTHKSDEDVAKILSELGSPSIKGQEGSTKKPGPVSAEVPPPPSVSRIQSK